MSIASALPAPIKARMIDALLRTGAALERSGVSRRLSLSLSQGGQDVWVYGEVFNEKRSGYFVDIGAHDGVHLSNTYLLERRYGWSGICVEANPITFDKLKDRRECACVHACLDGEERDVVFARRDVMGGIVSDTTDNRVADPESVISLRTRTLQSVLQERNAPRQIDYLSMDIEGAEERVLDAFDFDTYRFTCLTIERPSQRVRDLLKQHGYVVIKDLPWLDCFFVHGSFLLQYEANMMSFYDRRFLRLRWW